MTYTGKREKFVVAVVAVVVVRVALTRKSLGKKDSLCAMYFRKRSRPNVFNNIRKTVCLFYWDAC